METLQLHSHCILAAFTLSSSLEELDSSAAGMKSSSASRLQLSSQYSDTSSGISVSTDKTSLAVRPHLVGILKY